MSDRSDELVRQARDLIECIKQLRAALLDYQHGCEQLLKVGESGPPPGSTVESVELLKFAERRERLSTALTEFEAARRSARVGLISVAEEEGSSLTEVARVLNLSRQLLSRQAIEGRREDPEPGPR